MDSTAKRRGVIRILHVITGLGVGGAERLLLGTLKKLDRDRFDVRVCCLYNKGMIGQEIERIGVPVHDLGMRGFADPVAVGRLIAFLKQQRPDILHTHLYRANLWGRVIGRLLGIRILISSEHGLTRDHVEGRRRTRWISLVDTWMSRFTYRIIAVSDATKRYLMENGVEESRIQVIHNAVDPKEYEIEIDVLRKRLELGLDGASKVVTTIGRLHPQKGHRDLLEAFRDVTAGFPGVRLLIVGGGPLRNELLDVASRIDGGRCVVFAGERLDIAPILAMSDLVVGASLGESFGIAFIEAMAAGKPVIGTAVDGVPEVVLDGETGILVPPRDPGALAQAISVLLTDSRKAETMGRAGRARAQAVFNIDAMVAKLENLYTQAYSERHDATLPVSVRDL